jgi:hypothetical protein
MLPYQRWERTRARTRIGKKPKNYPKKLTENKPKKTLKNRPKR